MKILILTLFLFLVGEGRASQTYPLSPRVLLVRFNLKLIDWTLVDDDRIQTVLIRDLLNANGRKVLKDFEQKELFDISILSATKAFPHLKTSDSISISRQGSKVYMPPFWATFEVEIPDSLKYKEFSKILETLYPLIIFSDLPLDIVYNDAPNDSLFPYQLSLIDTLGSSTDINIDSAWNIETGKRFIKVGIFDTGIDSLHPDLDVLTGFSYYDDLILANPTDSFLTPSWGTDTYGHGTRVAGIIGAKRNNSIGVAGIAGGTGLDTTGVSLIDFKLGFGEGAYARFMAQSVIDAARAPYTYYSWTPNSPLETSYFDNAPGYGIYVGNHSYGMRVAQSLDTIKHTELLPYTTGVNDLPGDSIPPQPPVDDVACRICRESFLFSLQNGVTSIASRGNNFNLQDQYQPIGLFPASYHDSWVISVGASGTDGERLVAFSGNTAQFENYSSPLGNNIDVIAPGTKSLIATTSSTNNQPSNDTLIPYRTFNGTSASAPHVTGVVALLMSYFNKPCYNNGNLDPADIEYIIERSATKLSQTFPDDSSGWGRLNGYEALKMIKYPELQIIHPQDSPIFSNQISKDTITIRVDTPLNPLGLGPIGSSFPIEINKDYVVERIKYELFYDFGQYISPTTSLLDTWVRHSQTNSLMRYEDTATVFVGSFPPLPVLTQDKFGVEPMAEIDYTFGDSVIRLTGYYYHFIGQYEDTSLLCCGVPIPLIIVPVDYWYPINPSITAPKMAFSIYIQDSTLTSQYDFPCDSANPLVDSVLSLSEIEILDNDILIFPNPAKDRLTVIIPETLENGSVGIVDIKGQLVLIENEHLTSGKYQFNIKNLSNGLYFVSYESKGTKITKKWIKL
tara:strand:+ start:50894 stop:53443 length:2550 start_codon:yes stop_codon:yes gene_type:complete